jgi:hypothetical protein
MALPKISIYHVAHFGATLLRTSLVLKSATPDSTNTLSWITPGASLLAKSTVGVEFLNSYDFR